MTNYLARLKPAENQQRYLLHISPTNGEILRASSQDEYHLDTRDSVAPDRLSQDRARARVEVEREKERSKDREAMY